MCIVICSIVYALPAGYVMHKSNYYCNSTYSAGGSFSVYAPVSNHYCPLLSHAEYTPFRVPIPGRYVQSCRQPSNRKYITYRNAWFTA